ALNIPSSLPVGDFIVNAAEWTGKPLAELLELLTGASPVSVGALDEMTRLVDALRSTPEAAALVTSDDNAAETLERLRTWKGDVGAVTRGYRANVGLWLFSGYDLSDYCAIEVPIVLVRAIRASLERGPASRVDAAATQRLAAARDAVPAQHRAAFDALLE